MTKPTRVISESAAGFWVDEADADELTPQAMVTRQPANFVAPARTTIVQAQPTPGFDLSVLPTAYSSHVEDASDELTRARGFTVRTAPLAVAFAVTVGGIVLLANGTWWAIPATFATFSVVWGVMFVKHLNRSPAGVAWYSSTQAWKLLEREQKHRHQVDWYERQKGRQ
jgi:hypothetical protein